MAMSAERKAERKAARDRAKVLAGLKSVEGKVTDLGGVGFTCIMVSIDGVDLCGEIEAVNVKLEKLGYKPVRETRNMMNPDKLLFIDCDTPNCCDVGSEAYWSM